MPFYIGAAVIGIAIAFYCFVMPLRRQKSHLQSMVDTIENDIEQEQALHNELQHERRLLEQKDPYYLEKYARDNFGWAREGEIVYKLEETP